MKTTITKSFSTNNLHNGTVISKKQVRRNKITVYITLSVFLLLSIIPVFAFDEIETPITGHYIGAMAGMSTGIGLTYRYYPQNWGAQLTFGPYWDKKNLFVSTGFALFRTLHSTKYTKLFLYNAFSYNYSRMTESENEEATNSFMYGIGPGFEMYLLRNIALDFMFGYAAGNEYGIGYTIEGGIFYRF